MLYVYFATENSDPDRKQTLITLQEVSTSSIWMKWWCKRNKNMLTTKKKKKNEKKEREENTYWGKPHHFKNPNCKTKIHKEDDE